MPKSSELFPIKKADTGTTGTVVDTTPPRIVLLDKPITEIVNGKLKITIRTLLLDDDAPTATVPEISTKPNVSWVGVSPSSITTFGEEPVKVQLKISQTSSSPKVSWVSRSPDSVTTFGEEPVKVQLRVED
jgi:hypothetical protein